jgi:hypothetical protein
MTDLRGPLADLVAEVPTYVVPDARSAWDAGARRRRRRRLGAAAAVVVLVALTAGLINVLPRSADVPPADGERDGVDGYPARIEKPWFLHDLPDRPGPLAAVVETSGGGWVGVSARGRVWRIPQGDPIDSFPPALSADGRMLGYLAGHTTYVLRDLQTGEETSFPEVTDNAEVRADEGTWWAASQAPSFWSPDGARLVLRADRWDDHSGELNLVLGFDGSLREVPAHGSPVGWTDDDELAWISTEGERGAASASLVVTDAGGEVLRSAGLRMSPKDVDGLSQWSGSLAPGGDRLALTTADGSDAVTSTYDTSDGTRIERRRDRDVPDGCLTSWRDRGVVLPVVRDGAVALATASGETVLITDPALEAYCVLPAAVALEGHRHDAVGGVLGTGWLSWHWREVLLGGASTLLAIAGLVLLRRRRAGGEG